MRRFIGNKAVFGTLLVFFLMASIGGVFTSEMMDGGAAYNCPYMGVPVLCTMNPLQHLSEWQQTFAATVQQTSTIILLLLALYAALLISVRTRLPEPRAARAYRYRSPPSTPHRKKITHWLSLFENSPSQI